MNNTTLNCLGVILVLGIIYFVCVNIVNYNYIERYVDKNYPDYTITGKSYQYLSRFWSTYYDTEKDRFASDITCDTTLVNKNSGMQITIPFYHPKYQFYRDSQYNRKNIKDMVEEYENYWNAINDLKEKENIELNISNAIISEADNSDIYEITIYIKYKDGYDMQQMIKSINDIKTTLNINEINYLVAKEEIYDSLSPWTESNRHLIIPDDMEKIDNEASEVDLYIEVYNNGVKEYYEAYIK